MSSIQRAGAACSKHQARCCTPPAGLRQQAWQASPTNDAPTPERRARPAAPLQRARRAVAASWAELGVMRQRAPARDLVYGSVTRGRPGVGQPAQFNAATSVASQHKANPFGINHEIRAATVIRGEAHSLLCNLDPSALEHENAPRKQASR